MTWFVVRVLLHKRATEQQTPEAAYDNLHDAMEKAKFFRQVTANDGTRYEMLPAEYFAQSIGEVMSAERAHELAEAAVRSASGGRDYAVFVTATNDLCWNGLRRLR